MKRTITTGPSIINKEYYRIVEKEEGAEGEEEEEDTIIINNIDPCKYVKIAFFRCSCIFITVLTLFFLGWVFLQLFTVEGLVERSDSLFNLIYQQILFLFNKNKINTNNIPVGCFSGLQAPCIDINTKFTYTIHAYNPI
jgi:hypothetical protein